MFKIILFLLLSFSLFSDVSTYLSREVGADNATNRARADFLDDYWRGLVSQKGLCDNPIQFSLSTADISFPNASTVQTATLSGVNIAISNRDLPILLSNPPLTGNLGGSISISTSSTLQDNSPRPESLYNTLGQPGAVFESTGSNASRNGILFEFNQPVYAFGTWFGDLESNSLGTNALVRYFDSSGNQIGSDFTITSDPIILSSLSRTEATCGGVVGCGNQTTRFISFVADDNTPVSSMLVIVGDDSVGANGFLQHTSLIAPIVYNDLSCREADLEVIKTSPRVYFERDKEFDFELFLLNKGYNTATNVVLTDTLPSQIDFISVDDTNCAYNSLSHNVICNYSQMLTGETKKIILRAKANVAGTFINNISATLSEIDPKLLNNSTSVSTTISEITPTVVCPTPTPTPSVTPTITPTPTVEPVFCSYIDLTPNLLTIDSHFNVFVSYGNSIASTYNSAVRRKICSQTDINNIKLELQDIYEAAWTKIWSLEKSNFSNQCTLSSCIDISQSENISVLKNYLTLSAAELEKMLALNCVSSLKRKQIRAQIKALSAKLTTQINGYPSTIKKCTK